MKKNYAMIDILKLIFAFGIIALHTGFLLNYFFGYYIHTIIFRLGVPFFFFASGFFLAKKEKDNLKENSLRYIKSLLMPYITLSIIFLVLNAIRYDDFLLSSLMENLWLIFTGRSQSVIWFIGSLILSTVLLLHLDNNKKVKITLAILLILYLVGLSFNTYAFALKNETFSFLYNFLIGKFSNNSNFLFIGAFYFILGYSMCKKIIPDKIFKFKYILLFLSSIFLVCEVVLIKLHLDTVVNYEYFVSHIILIPTIFYIALNTNINISTVKIRKISTYIYYFHYIFIILLILLNNIYNNIYLNNSNIFYIITVILTIVFSYFFQTGLKNVKNIKEKYIKVFIIALYSISFIYIVFALLGLLNKVVWADEICSLSMIKHSFVDIIKININDVHPPLYYLAVKYFNDFFSIIIPNVNPIIISKIFSFIPYIIIVLLINTSFRKKFGLLTASLATFFITCMPQMLYYFFEIRMYSWAMCIVTLTFLFLKKVIESKRNKDWFIFIIFGTISSYLHLYGALAFAILYFSLLIYLLIKDRKEIKKWFIFGFCYFILYSPWLIVIYNQLKTVSNGFWIPSLTLSTILNYFKFFLSFDNNEHWMSNILLIFSLIFIFICVYFNVRKSNKNKENIYYSITGILSLFILIIISILISIIKNPIFVSRYMFVLLGTFWIGISILYSELIKKNYKIMILILLPFIISLWNYKSLIKTEIEKNENIKNFYSLINQIKKEEDVIIITNDIHKEFEIAYFLNNHEIHLWQQSNNESMEKLYGNIYNNANNEIIVGFLKKSKNVYYVSDTNDEAILTHSDNKIKSELVNTVVADWYYMNFYKISLNNNTKSNFNKR